MRETIFVWDSVNDCVMSELDGSGAVQVTYTNEPQQYGGVISQRRGTTTSTCHADALGSTRALTDSSGNVTDTYLNDAWGNSVASTGTTVNPFKWVGKYGYYTDNSTGQVYVRARMYQPTAASWCSADPASIILDASYADCTPVLLVDPSGLETERHFDIVAKSFINGLPRIGAITPDRFGIGPMPPEWGITPIPPTFTATDRLGIAAKVFIKFPAFNENPAAPAKDGVYRLYTRLDIDAKCCDGKLTIKHTTDMDGGKEAPLIYGTINLSPMIVLPLPSGGYDFLWRGWGRPNLLAEPGMQWVAIRSSRNIWHYPSVRIECDENDTPAVTKASLTGGITGGSRFPSHRLWVNGAIVDNLDQGNLSDLWYEHSPWTGFVR